MGAGTAMSGPPRLLISKEQIARNFEQFVTADARAVGRAFNSTAALVGQVGTSGANAAHAVASTAGRGLSRVAALLLRSALGVKLSWLPPAGCDLRCEETAQAQREGCLARQRACIEQLSLQPSSASSTTGQSSGLSIEYDPLTLKALGLVVMLFFVFCLYVWQSSLYYGGPNLGTYDDPLDRVARGSYLYKQPKQPYVPMQAVQDISRYARETSLMGAGRLRWGAGYTPPELDELAKLLADEGVSPDELQKLLASEPEMSSAKVLSGGSSSGT